MLLLIGPVRMHLPPILLGDYLVVSLANVLAIVVMIDPLLPVALNDILA